MISYKGIFIGVAVSVAVLWATSAGGHVNGPRQLEIYLNTEV